MKNVWYVILIAIIGEWALILGAWYAVLTFGFGYTPSRWQLALLLFCTMLARWYCKD